MDERGTSQPEVLIVGAGPTGLSAAIALGRLGVDVCVVERREGTSQHPRGHVENGRTMELMRLWGVDSRIREQGLPREFLSGVAFMTRIAGLDLGDIMFDSQSEWLMSDDGAGPASLSSTPQDRLEPILLETARQTGAQVRFSTELLDLQNTADGVSATVRGPDGEEILHAAYAIAADGPRSRVRDLLGIPVEGPGVLGAQLGIYFHADLSPWVTDRPRALYWIYNPDVQGVVIALDGRDRWHLLFAYDEQRESVEDYPPERCAAIVRELIGSEEVEVDVRSVLPWRMRAAVAEHFRAGRVFLAGDAAHTMPPTGGMGMNSGIGDVHNLAWKLHAVLRGDAGAELLDTYEPERLPVGRRNTENSVANARTMAETGLAGILVSDPEGFAVIEQPHGAALRERIATAVPGQEEHFSFDGLSFGYCYESDAVVPDGSEDVPSGVGDYHPTARPGARAPHHWLERDGATVSTIDLSDGRWVLLAPGADWVSAARVVAADLSVSVDAFRVGRDDDADLVDRRGGWAEQYQVGEAGAVLIRPDGHVAWRSASAAQDAADARDTLGAVLAGVLHRSATVALG